MEVGVSGQSLSLAIRVVATELPGESGNAMIRLRPAEENRATDSRKSLNPAKLSLV